MIVPIGDGGAVDVHNSGGRINLGVLASPEVAMTGSETKKLIEALCVAYKTLTGHLPFALPKGNAVSSRNDTT